MGCWVGLPARQGARPKKVQCLRLQPSRRCCINSSPHSFIHPSIHQTLVKRRRDKQTFIGPQPRATYYKGGGYLSVPSSTFTVTLNGSKYYFLSQEAEENQVSEWEGNLLKGTSWEEPEQVLSPGISDPKSCSSRCTQK